MRRISEFLGYAPSELEGHSAYEFHHVIDNEMILKSYKTSTKHLFIVIDSRAH